MTVEKLARVLWRLRKNNPGNDMPTWLELKRAIMYECGTDPRTYIFNRNALKNLGWIKVYNGKRLRLTNDDLTT